MMWPTQSPPIRSKTVACCRLRMAKIDIEVPLAEFYVGVLFPGGEIKRGAEVDTGEIA
jgi:hypothetical protein